MGCASAGRDQATLPVGLDLDQGPVPARHLYVEELIGPETISTIPEDTIRAFRDHGRIDPTVEDGLEEANTSSVA